MAGENYVTTANGLLKKIHAEGIERLVPQNTSLAKDMGFVPEDEREGDVFAQPVLLGREHGYTLSAAGGGGGAVTLNAQVAAQFKEAQVQGAEFYLRAVIAYSLLAKAGSGGSRSYGRMLSIVIQNMTETAHWVREFELLYGGGTTGLSNLGEIESNSGATTPALVISRGTWAPGIWAGAENMFVDCYDDDWDPKRNIANTMKVTGVAIDTRTLTITGTESETDTIVANDKLVVRGGYANEMAGVDAIVSNTGSLNGIDAAAFSMWKGSSHSVASAALVFSEIIKGLNKPVARGLMSPVNLYASIFSWSDMMNDLAALRRYTSDEGTMELGANELVFQGANGAIKVKPHTMIKGGEAFALCMDHWERVGPTDLTFSLDGTGENFASNSANSAGLELRNMWIQAPFCSHPAKQLKFTNVLNSST